MAKAEERAVCALFFCRLFWCCWSLRKREAVIFTTFQYRADTARDPALGCSRQALPYARLPV